MFSRGSAPCAVALQSAADPAARLDTAATGANSRRWRLIPPGDRLEDAVPWLSEEVPGWEDMSEEERDVFRRVVENLGMDVDADDDDGYYE